MAEKRLPCILPSPCPLFGDCGYYHTDKQLSKLKEKWYHDFEGKSSVNNCKNGREISLERNPVVKEKKVVQLLGSHEIFCDKKLFVYQLDKGNSFEWTFKIKPKTGHPNTLKEIILVDPDTPEFFIKSVRGYLTDITLKDGCQSFSFQGQDMHNFELCEVVIGFISQFDGNYHQNIYFRFKEEVETDVSRSIGVQVLAEIELVKHLEYKPPLTKENELAWLKKYKVIPFDSDYPVDISQLKYQLPPNISDMVKFGAFDNLKRTLTKQNYKGRQHFLLYIEEQARREELEGLSFTEDNLNRFVKDRISGATRHRVLEIPMESDSIQRLVRLVGKSGSVLVKIIHTDEKVVVYEIRYISYSADYVLFEMSKELDTFLEASKEYVKACFCFRFMVNFQFMHAAIDKVNLDIIFPSHGMMIPSVEQPWERNGLTKKQSEAAFHITDIHSRPPVLILGPFGSGKTRTLAASVLLLLESIVLDLAETGKTNKHILLCTHSNSAADYYINNYIHPYLSKKNKMITAIQPLRINWEYRYSASISDAVLRYSLVDQRTGYFLKPTKEELDKHVLVISTLVTANELWDTGIEPGYFTHIIIDEAAQAIEMEAIIPLSLADTNTRIVLAGDHLQLSPPVISTVTRDLGMERSLLERMFKDYPAESPCKLKFDENFRSHRAIVNLASLIFYSDTLVCRGKQFNNQEFPIYFHGVSGKEERSKSDPSYFNRAEISEILNILERIEKIRNESEKGPLECSRICVLAPYTAQIRETRTFLRRHGFGGVSVDTIHNVQGLEFDEIIISTVRTYCEETINDEVDGKSLGYLSDPKMLNTAITRAKLSCYFVGDPIALCHLGSCRTCWKVLLEKCEKYGTFLYQRGFQNVLSMVGEEAIHIHQGKTSKIENNCPEQCAEYTFNSNIPDSALYCGASWKKDQTTVNSPLSKEQDKISLLDEMDVTEGIYDKILTHYCLLFSSSRHFSPVKASASKVWTFKANENSPANSEDNCKVSDLLFSLAGMHKYLHEYLVCVCKRYFSFSDYTQVEKAFNDIDSRCTNLEGAKISGRGKISLIQLDLTNFCSRLDSLMLKKHVKLSDENRNLLGKQISDVLKQLVVQKRDASNQKEKLYNTVNCNRSVLRQIYLFCASVNYACKLLEVSLRELTEDERTLHISLLRLYVSKEFHLQRKEELGSIKMCISLLKKTTFDLAETTNMQCTTSAVQPRYFNTLASQYQNNNHPVSVVKLQGVSLPSSKVLRPGIPQHVSPARFYQYSGYSSLCPTGTAVLVPRNFAGIKDLWDKPPTKHRSPQSGSFPHRPASPSEPYGNKYALSCQPTFQPCSTQLYAPVHNVSPVQHSQRIPQVLKENVVPEIKSSNFPFYYNFVYSMQPSPFCGVTSAATGPDDYKAPYQNTVNNRTDVDNLVFRSFNKMDSRREREQSKRVPDNGEDFQGTP